MDALGIYASLALICACSALLGHGLRAALGDTEWSWTSPAVGLAALIVLGGLAIRLPGRATTAAVLLVAVSVAALAVAWRRGVGTTGGLGVGVAVLAAMIVAASLPFAAAGGFGVLGPDVNQDIVTHLVNAESLDSDEEAEPPQVANGYPIGPHGLAATTNALTGAGLEESFTAILIAGAVVAALASLAVLGGLAPVPRVVGSTLVGMPYLAASFYVQSAFKEVLMGVLVLAFAIGLRQAVGEDREHRDTGRTAAVATGASLGMLAAGALQTYSFAGLAWLGAATAGWMLAALAMAGRAQWRELWARAGGLLPVAAAGLAVLAIVTLADLPRIIDFLSAEETGFADTAVANLVDRVPLQEALGTWPQVDYRFDSPGAVTGDLLAVVGLLALGLGVAQLARRGELALLASLASVAAAYAVARAFLGIYTESKALAIAAPLVMLAAVYGVLGPLPRRLRGSAANWARTALAVVFVGSALASSYVALTGAKVHRDNSGEALASLREEVHGAPILFLSSDLFAGRELSGLLVSGTKEGPLEERGRNPTTKLDFDTYVPEVLDLADYAITGRTPYASEPPPNFHREKASGPFVLWERTGPTPDRETLNESGAPGTVLDCSTPEGRRIARMRGTARIFDPSPVHGSSAAWAGADGAELFYPQLADGRSAEQELKLSPGRWEISLQYASPEALEITAPGLDTRAPPRLEIPGAFWPIGTVAVAERAPVPFTIRVEDPSFVRDVIGALAPAPAAGLGAIAATAVGGDRDSVPLSEACGEFVDWYRLDP